MASNDPGYHATIPGPPGQMQQQGGQIQPHQTRQEQILGQAPHHHQASQHHRPPTFPVYPAQAPAQHAQNVQVTPDGTYHFASNASYHQFAANADLPPFNLYEQENTPQSQQGLNL